MLFYNHEIKKEYLERLEKSLSAKDYESYLRCFDDKETHGMTINYNKLKKSSIDLDYIVKKFDLNRVYENESFGYYIYDKEKLSMNGIYPGKDPLYHVGLYYIQEPSAAKVMYNVPIKSSDVVLDLCASPGGKSIETLYSLKKEDGGFLVSNEIDRKRVKTLNSNIERMGFENVAIVSEESKNLADRFSDCFDKVIVDAPCSGEGMFRKSEEARLQWSEELVKSCARLQKALVDDAYKMLKNGGVLIYSTCTFSEEEDEDVVDSLVKKYNDLKIICMEKNYPFNSIGEGQFYAIIKKDGINDYKNGVLKKDDFEGLNLIRYGISRFAKDTIYEKNNKYKTNKDDDIKPSHESTHIDDIVFENVVDLDDTEVYKYLKGETIKKDLNFNGYCKITYKNIGLGLAKYSGGILKNHYPKGLRLLQ